METKPITKALEKTYSIKSPIHYLVLLTQVFPCTLLFTFFLVGACIIQGDYSSNFC